MATTFFGSLANALKNISFHALGNHVYSALIDVKRNFERNIPFKWLVTLVCLTENRFQGTQSAMGPR